MLPHDGYIRQGYVLLICHCRIHTTSIFPSYLPMSYTYDMRFSFLFANVVYIRHNRSFSAILDKIHLARNFYWLVCGARSIIYKNDQISQFFFNVRYIRHWQNKKTIFLKADFSAIEFPFFLNTSASRVKICMWKFEKLKKVLEKSWKSPWIRLCFYSGHPVLV